MVELILNVVLLVMTMLALINAALLVRVITKGLKLDDVGFKKFDRATFILYFALLFLSVGQFMSVTGMSEAYSIGLQFVWVLLSLAAVYKLSSIPANISGSLEVDWGSLKEDMEGHCPACKDHPAKTYGIVQHLWKKNIVVVEVEDMGILPVFHSLSHELSELGYNIFPVIGAITPFDLKRMWDTIGKKSGLWITQSDIEDEWVKDRFVIVKPSELFQLTSYIKVVMEKYGNNVIFLGDFLDEIHNSVDEKQLHQLLSKLKSMFQKNKSLFVLVVDKNLHSAEDIELLHRYSDARLVFDGKTKRVKFFDLQNNTEKDLGKI